MPISVVCPGCKARFQVGDKFAGKQGPCPKCKAIITIPKEEVKIHAPEDDAVKLGGKTSTGQPLHKPTTREKVEVKPIVLIAIIVAIIAACATAWALGENLRDKDSAWLRALGLLIVGVPITAAGYSFLRDDEFEPFRGQKLWLRAAICSFVFLMLWVGFYFLPERLTTSQFSWVFVAPVCLAIGAYAATLTFDLEFGSGFFHYAFYVSLCLLLRWLAGMDWIWQKAPPLNM